MNRYMMLIYGTGEGLMELPEAERNAHMQKWGAWTDELMAKGKYAAGDPVGPEARTVSGAGATVREGFGVPDKQYAIGGYYIFNADSLDEATELAKGCPALEFDGTVEVRPVVEM